MFSNLKWRLVTLYNDIFDKVVLWWRYMPSTKQEKIKNCLTVIGFIALLVVICLCVYYVSPLGNK